VWFDDSMFSVKYAYWPAWSCWIEDDGTMLASVRRTSGPFGLLMVIIRWVLLWLSIFGPIVEVVACSGLAVE